MNRNDLILPETLELVELEKQPKIISFDSDNHYWTFIFSIVDESRQVKLFGVLARYRVDVWRDGKHIFWEENVSLDKFQYSFQGLSYRIRFRTDLYGGDGKL